MVNESEGSENEFALKNTDVEEWERAEFWEADRCKIIKACVTLFYMSTG